MSPRSAAFGADPGRSVRVRPGMSAVDRWLVAVALGGQGRYAAAATELGRLLGDPRVPPAVAAHAAVTRASHRRQLGGPTVARRDDAFGLRLACAATSQAGAGPDGPDPDGTGGWAARIDAVVGLAADDVGLGDVAGAGRLLDLADRWAEQCHRRDGGPGWRPAVRSGWVRAELALVRDRAQEAWEPAAAALTRARSAGSVRHILKSRLVLAVAHGAARTVDADSVVAELDEIGAECARLGLAPLQWACGLAAADLVDRVGGTAADGRSGANDAVAHMAQRSAGDRRNDAPRRRHAAAATMSDIAWRGDPLGRRLMGVWM